MRIHATVEYQIGVGVYGTGTVIAFDEETEIVTVKDDDDGSTWRGLADHATVLQNE